jgi:hypothetical protein
MVPLLSRVRASSRLIVVHTTERAVQRMAQALDIDSEELVLRMTQAPAERREDLLELFAQPDNQGCIHLRQHLRRGGTAAALLRAFLTGRWYGWPGLRLEVAASSALVCCCGGFRQRSHAPLRGLRPMDGIDI